MDIMVKTNDNEFGRKLLDFLKEHEDSLADDPVYADRMVWSAYDSHEIEEQVKLALEDDSYGITEFYSLQEITKLVMDELDREVQNGHDLDSELVGDTIESTRSEMEQVAEALHEAKDNMENKHISPLRQAELLKAIKKVEKPFGIHEHHNGLYPDGAREEISLYCKNVLKPLSDACNAVAVKDDTLLIMHQVLVRDAVDDYEAKRPAYMAGAVMFTDAPDTPHAINDATYACQTVRSGKPCEEAIHDWLLQLGKAAQEKTGVAFVTEVYKATSALKHEMSPAFLKHNDMDFIQKADNLMQIAKKTIPEFRAVAEKIDAREQQKNTQNVK